MSDLEDSVLLHSPVDSPAFKSPSPDLLDPRSSLNSCIFVDPKEEELEGLLYAARHGDIQTILALLESYYSGSQLNLNATSNNKSHGWTALHWAVYMGHDSIVELLLKNGASPNVQNDQGDTALHKAAYTNRCSTVSLLLNYNADVSLKNSLGNTAVSLCESEDVKDVLVGAARGQERQKEVLLLEVAKRGELRLIQELIDSPDPPSINCKDEDGNTALHIASYRGHTHLIIYLMHSGININIKNNNNQKAADLAKNSKTQQLLNIAPLQTSVGSLQIFQGPLLKRYLLTKFKLVWVVLCSGSIEIYPIREEAVSITKRNIISKKDLTNCRVSENKKDTLTFRIIYDTDTDDIFRVPVMNDGNNRESNTAVKSEVTREMWVHAFRSHTDHLSKRSPIVIIDQAEMNGRRKEKRVSSLSEGIRIAEAHMSLFQKHVTGVNESAQLIDQQLDPAIMSLVRQLHDTLTLAMQTKTQLMNCLTNLHQQEDMSQLLAHEVEKNRVLEESLHILASENQSLQDMCRSSSFLTPGGGAQFISGPTYQSGRYTMTPADQYQDALTDLSLDSAHGFTLHEGFDKPHTEINTQITPMLDLTIRNSLFTNSTFRNELPAPAPTVDFSIWAVLKNCIGKDLSRISMPVFLNEPLSMLQRVAESLEYSLFFRKVLECDDPLVRIQMVTGKLILAQISQIYRFKKPFNPVLGETFEFVDEEYLKVRFIAEQVSHHPPIGAFNLRGEGFESQGTLHAKVSFWGKSVEISPLGGVTIKLDNGDVYTANNVTTIVHNIIVGKMWMEKYGVMEVTNHTTKDKCILNFKPAGWFGKDLYWVDGCVLDAEKKRRYIVQGKWPYELWSYPTNGEMSGNSSDTERMLIYKCPPGSTEERNYFFSKLAMNLNNFPPEMTAYLPPTDSRRRSDIRSLEEGDLDGAGTHKHRIEEKQREHKRSRESRKVDWTPLWFEQRESPYTQRMEWAFTEKYWERDFSNSPDIF